MTSTDTVTLCGARYYSFACDISSVEPSDDVFFDFTMRSGAFDFWKDPREDVYTLEDGEPIEEMG